MGNIPDLTSTVCQHGKPVSMCQDVGCRVISALVTEGEEGKDSDLSFDDERALPAVAISPVTDGPEMEPEDLERSCAFIEVLVQAGRLTEFEGEVFEAYEAVRHGYGAPRPMIRPGRLSKAKPPETYPWYVVRSPFKGGGEDWQPGQVVPGSKALRWRLLPKLVSQGYLAPRLTRPSSRDLRGRSPRSRTTGRSSLPSFAGTPITAMLRYIDGPFAHADRSSWNRRQAQVRRAWKRVQRKLKQWTQKEGLQGLAERFHLPKSGEAWRMQRDSTGRLQRQRLALPSSQSVALKPIPNRPMRSMLAALLSELSGMGIPAAHLVDTSSADWSFNLRWARWRLRKFAQTKEGRWSMDRVLRALTRKCRLCPACRTPILEGARIDGQYVTKRRAFCSDACKMHMRRRKAVTVPPTLAASRVVVKKSS